MLNRKLFFVIEFNYVKKLISEIKRMLLYYKYKFLINQHFGKVGQNNFFVELNIKQTFKLCWSKAYNYCRNADNK